MSRFWVVEVLDDQGQKYRFINELMPAVVEVWKSMSDKQPRELEIDGGKLTITPVAGRVIAVDAQDHSDVLKQRKKRNGELYYRFGDKAF